MQTEPNRRYASTWTGDRWAGTLLLLAAIIVGTSFVIADLIVAYEDGDDTCQGIDSTHITLKTWILVCGYTGLFQVIVFALGLVVLWITNDVDCIGFSAFLMKGIMALMSLFGFAWWIIGIVITARSHGECVVRNTSIGALTMVHLCLTAVALLSSCTSTNRD